MRSSLVGILSLLGFFSPEQRGKRGKMAYGSELSGDQIREEKWKTMNKNNYL